MRRKFFIYIGLVAAAFMAELAYAAPPPVPETLATFVAHKFSDKTYGPTVDGRGPVTAPVEFVDGKLYGATSLGGINRSGGVYSLDTSDNERWLFSFRPYKEGSAAVGQLVAASDNRLYGVNSFGGRKFGGTIYRFDPSIDRLDVLVAFEDPNGNNASDISPYHPTSGVMQVGNAFYGTTMWGGKTVNGDGVGAGTVYKLANREGLSVLHKFNSHGTEGRWPAAGLVRGNDGLLYGVTSAGGQNGAGTIYRMATNGTMFEVLHSFTLDEGTTARSALTTVGSSFFGTTDKSVFRFDLDGSLTILHSFPAYDGDGIKTTSALMLGPDGALYGTTQQGGSSIGSNIPYGTVYRVALDGAESILATFYEEPSSGGYSPLAERLTLFDGKIYGACVMGGKTPGWKTTGFGTVFKVPIQ